MPQQPELTPHPLPASPAPQPGTELALGLSPPREGLPETHGPERIPRWLERSELFLRVLLQMYFGLLICYTPWSGVIFKDLPWSRELWDHNPVWGLFPGLGTLAVSGAVRGIVSGLGLLNLWIAFHDAIRHETENQ